VSKETYYSDCCALEYQYTPQQILSVERKPIEHAVCTCLEILETEAGLIRSLLNTVSPKET
jgi:hypothetical protein